MGFDIGGIRDKVNKLREIKGNFTDLLTGNFGAFLPKNPQKSYLWEVSISGTQHSIKLFAKSATIPQQSIDPIIINFMGETIRYAGKEASTKTITLTFWDDERSTVLEYMTNWFTEVHENKTGYMLEERDYRRTVSINLKDSTDITSTSNVKLTGAFIIDMAEIQLSYDNSEAIEISVTIQYELREVSV